MQKDIPVLTVSGRSLAEAYENALRALYRHGVSIPTQYDKPGDPPSLDSTMNITILEPGSDPMIHKAFPGGIEDLKEYSMELRGLKDHWVKNMNDPADTRWEYTYHGRLSAYGIWRELLQGESQEKGFFRINQIEVITDKLARQPFTRQAQMITWMPHLDNHCFDPPCLQSLWYRILEDEEGIWWLNCNVRFRSNDAWGASFMNMFGFIQFNQSLIADAVGRKAGKKVLLGRMNWHADSYHIYGKDIASARRMLFDRADSIPFSSRTWNFSDTFIRELFDEAEAGILEKIKEYDRSHGSGPV